MADKKRILIISYYFAPQNVIGAVRATKLAKYLSRMGHEVTVLCAEGVTPLKDPTLARDLEELTNVHVVREWNPIRDHKQKQAMGQGETKKKIRADDSIGREKKSTTEKIKDFLYLLLLRIADRSFACRGIRKLRGLRRNFDVVISSFGPISAHSIARKAKQEGITRRWIADFRDEVNTQFAWEQRIARRIAGRMIQKADGISAVSRGVLDSLGSHASARVMPNGFDREDLAMVLPQEREDFSSLRFVYCGQLYGGKRDLTPFFHAVARLIAEGFCGAGDLEVIYAGGEGNILKEQAHASGIEDVVQDYGYLTREKSLSLQSQADVLLLASWNDQGTEGVLTGKLLEYLMMEKPVVCCISGALAQSEIKKLLHEAEIGMCYEQANAQEDQEKLYQYLRRLLERKRQGVRLLEKADLAVSRRFSYSQIAMDYARWMEEMGV